MKNLKARKPSYSPERGAGLVECALLIALVGLVGMASVRSMGQSVSQKYSDIEYAVAGGGAVGNETGAGGGTGGMN